MRQAPGIKCQMSNNKHQLPRLLYQLAPHPTLLSLLLFTLLSLLIACATGSTAAQGAGDTPVAASPTPTPTSPPPPPHVAYTPVPENTVSPIIVQRFPRRGEEMPPDGNIELVFDRPMNQDAVAQAFTLQLAAEPPQPVQGKVAWPNARTMRFAPAKPLERASVYDAILTQAAVAADGAPLAEPFTFRFSTAGYLEVAQVIPADGTANVETRPNITVMFNRPVVPLTSLAESAKFPQPLTFDPPISGQGEWLNTSIYTFAPNKDLPGGITFKATVKAGLKDVAGQTILPNDFRPALTVALKVMPPGRSLVGTKV